MDGFTDGRTDIWMDGWTDVWMDVQIDGQMDGQRSVGQMDRLTGVCGWTTYSWWRTPSSPVFPLAVRLQNSYLHSFLLQEELQGWSREDSPPSLSLSSLEQSSFLYQTYTTSSSAQADGLKIGPQSRAAKSRAKPAERWESPRVKEKAGEEASNWALSISCHISTPQFSCSFFFITMLMLCHVCMQMRHGAHGMELLPLASLYSLPHLSHRTTSQTTDCTFITGRV